MDQMEEFKLKLFSMEAQMTLIQKELAEKLGLLGPHIKLVLGDANMDGVVEGPCSLW